VRRWLARCAVIVPAVGLALGVFTAPASAHAYLERTAPAATSILKTSPAAVTLTFDESVIAAKDALQLYDDHLQRVELGPTGHPAGRGSEIQAIVPSSLHKGTYTVTWRVTSADTHVVSGGFTFSVRNATPVTGTPASAKPDDATTTAADVVRGLGYLALILGPGAIVVLLWLWPAGFADRRVRRLVLGGCLLLAVVTLVGVYVQGAQASGRSLTGAMSSSSLRLGFDGRYGRASIERLVLLFLLLQTIVLGHYVTDRRRRALLVSLVAALLAATWPFAGHAAEGSLVPLSFVADWVHVAAMATWLGGLVVLLGVVLRQPAHPERPAIVADFSEWALAAVSLIVATGLFAAWRNVRSWGALPATGYGQLLLVKSGAVLLIVAVAWLSRRHVQRLTGAGGGNLGRLRATVYAEAGVAVVVLSVTSVLTATPLAHDVYAPAITRTATEGGVTVTVHVDRPRVGSTTLVVSTTRLSGAPQRITHIDGSLTEADPPIGPLPIRFREVATGREVATVAFSDEGDWELQLDVRTSAINEIAVTTTIPIR
jgi:copper transport protein